MATAEFTRTKSTIIECYISSATSSKYYTIQYKAKSGTTWVSPEEYKGLTGSTTYTKNLTVPNEGCYCRVIEVGGTGAVNYIPSETGEYVSTSTSTSVSFNRTANTYITCSITNATSSLYYAIQYKERLTDIYITAYSGLTGATSYKKLISSLDQDLGYYCRVKCTNSSGTYETYYPSEEGTYVNALLDEGYVTVQLGTGCKSYTWAYVHNGVNYSGTATGTVSVQCHHLWIGYAYPDSTHGLPWSRVKYYVANAKSWTESGDFNTNTVNTTITPKRGTPKDTSPVEIISFGAASKTYTLVYDNKGGTGGPGTVTASDTEDYHDFTVPNETPSKDGYTFKGWCNNSSATTVHYTTGSTVRVGASSTNTKTIYAVWVANTYYYELTYNANGGYYAPGKQTSGGYVTQHPYVFTLSPNEALHYSAKFLWWTENAAGTGNHWSVSSSYTTNNSSSTLYAQWDTGYTITILANPTSGGTFKETGTSSATALAYGNTTWTISNGVLKFTDTTGTALTFTPTPSDGNKFDSWNQSSSGTISSNMTFIATFTGKIINVTIDKNGGTVVDGYSTHFKNRKLKVGSTYQTDYSDGETTPQTITLPDATMITKANNDFSYLQNTTTEASVTNTTTVTTTSDHSVKVIWSPITYTIKFDSNYGTPTFANLTLDNLQAIIPGEKSEINYTPYRENYIFCGWKSESGTIYYPYSEGSEEDLYTIKYSNEKAYFDRMGHILYLTAQWMPELAINVMTRYNGIKKIRSVPIETPYRGVSVNLTEDAEDWHNVIGWWTYTADGWKYMIDNE